MGNLGTRLGLSASVIGEGTGVRGTPGRQGIMKGRIRTWQTLGEVFKGIWPTRGEADRRTTTLAVLVLKDRSQAGGTL